MLLQFSCTNFRSIRSEVMFSFLASSDAAGDERVYRVAGLRVLPAAAIYGANGSGKTTLIQAISLMKHLVTQSVQFQPGDLLPFFPHKLSKPDEATAFDIQFIVGGTRYAYGLSYQSDRIVSEVLYRWDTPMQGAADEHAAGEAVPGGEPTRIFERGRDIDRIVIGTDYEASLATARNVIKQNRLFLSCAANFTPDAEIERVFLYLKHQIVHYNGNDPEWLLQSARMLHRNPAAKAFALEFLSRIGSGIRALRTESYSRQSVETQVGLSELTRGFLASPGMRENETEDYRIRLNYADFDIEFSEESRGVRKLIEILCPLFEMIREGKLLLWDELESSLHPVIVPRILMLFQEEYRDNARNGNAQLLFTTHDINLLDLRIFRQDQIWFTEMRADRSTDLYSLLEMENVQSDENVRRGYLNGRYGALPCLQGQNDPGGVR